MSTLRPPPPVDGPIDAERVRAAVRAAFTGNTARDLRHWTGDELAIAEDEHVKEAARRFERGEALRRAQGRHR